MYIAQSLLVLLLAVTPALATSGPLPNNVIVRRATPSQQIIFCCPPQDLAGFPLGAGSSFPFCSYPAFAGENPNDFFCTYDPTSGVLVQDHDAGFCPPTASNCTPGRKRKVALGELVDQRPAGKIRVEMMDQGLLDKRAIWAKKRQEAGAGMPQKV